MASMTVSPVMEIAMCTNERDSSGRKVGRHLARNGQEKYIVYRYFGLARTALVTTYSGKELYLIVLNSLSRRILGVVLLPRSAGD